MCKNDEIGDSKWSASNVAKDTDVQTRQQVMKEATSKANTAKKRMKQQVRSVDPESITSTGNLLIANDLPVLEDVHELTDVSERTDEVKTSVSSADSEPDIDEHLETEVAEETAMEMSDGLEEVAEEMEHITANARNMGQGSQGEDIGLRIPVVQVDVGMKTDYKDCVKRWVFEELERVC